MIRLVVSCETLEQLETLLLATRAVGLTPDLGVGPEPPPSRRRKERSTKRRKKVRHARSMNVTMGKRPKGPPKLIEIHEALSDEFGSRIFAKRDAKPVIIRRMRMKQQSVSPYVTKLMDVGGIVAAH